MKGKQTVDQVTAEVRYLNSEWKGRDDRPFIYSKSTRQKNTTKYPVEITDARELAADGRLDLDSNGFVLTKHDTKVDSFHEELSVKASYETEIVPMLQRLTGATLIRVVGHQLRTEEPKTFLGAYSRYLHCDYPLTPSEDRESNLLGRSVEGLKYAWYNIWEPVDRPATQNQLTVLDARTLDLQEDICEYHFTDKREGGYAAIPVYNKNHRFYYFSNMKPGEAIVFKQFDSRPGKAFVCPHTAFYDPNRSPNQNGRRSVEFRALCVFE